MNFADVLSGVLGGSTMISSIGTIANQANANKLNYQSQQDQLAYQKQAQATTWNREDSAVQRRVEDLRRAGLSPVLAAGSAAQTSAPINVTAPMRQATNLSPIGDASRMVMNLISQNQDIARTQAQVNLINANAENAKVSKELILENILNTRKRTDLLGSDMALKNADLLLKSQGLENLKRVYENLGLTTESMKYDNILKKSEANAYKDITKGQFGQVMNIVMMLLNKTLK